MPAPRTETIRDVALVKVGTWAASTGVTKVTRQDLEAMLAAHADGLVDHAPVKLGHESSLNDGIGDGSPAYGWVVPTRIEPDANGVDTLIGDLVGMPAQLAAIAPTAYRRRSVEIAWEVKTAQGKTYAAALIGIALLGATPPAVKGLDDVVALYSGDPDVARTSALELVDGLEANTVAVAMLAAARQAGAPVEQLDAMAEAAGASDTADVPPPVADVANDDTDSTADSGATETTDTGGHTMTDEELRAALNLEQDADLNAELRRILDERGETPADETPADETPADETPADETPADERELAGAAQLSAEELSAFRSFVETQATERRNSALSTAVREGRIAPAEVAHFRAQLEKGGEVEASTITLLGQLAQRFEPGVELGSDNAEVTALSKSTADAFDDFEAKTFGLDRSKQ